jgi:protein-disulfide isomerase
LPQPLGPSIFFHAFALFFQLSPALLFIKNYETKAIDENIKLAERLGISGAPTLIFHDGRVIPGYKDAKTLINLIGN